MMYNATSSNSLGDIEQTQNLRVNHIALNCDLDLESV